MDSTRNIASTQTTGSATAQPAGKALSQNDILAFMQILSAKSAASQATTGTTPAANTTANTADTAGTEKSALTAKITALLNANPAAAQKLQADMQALAPQANAQTGAQTSGGIQSTLTSDLASQLATLLQSQGAANGQDDGQLMQQLQSMFNNMPGLNISGLSAGSTDITAFRTDAIKMMKSMGMSDDDIQKTLEKFAAAQNLNPEQTAQLAAPLQQAPVQTAAVTAAPKAKDNAAAAVSADTSKPKAQDAAQAPAQTPAQAKAQAQQAAQQGNDPQAAPRQQADAGTPAPAPQAPVQAPKADTAQAQTSHIALVNSLASQDGTNSFDSNFNNNSGQGFAQDGSGAQGMTGVTSATSASSASFVNYLNDSPQAAQGTATQMVALQIQKNAASSVSNFTMQLNPAELGGVEIRLKFGKDGLMKAQLIADKPETLNMLQKDSPVLHKMLQDAGLGTKDGALSFDLRQQNEQGNSQQSNNGGNRARGYGADLDDMISDNAIQAKLAVASAGYIRQGGVNITV